ncbi:MAG: hypothetical protein ACM3X9_15145 [Bacillota bacterium]
MTANKGDDFTKKVIKLDDGRELIYYDFDDSPSPDAVDQSKVNGEKPPKEN